VCGWAGLTDRHAEVHSLSRTPWFAGNFSYTFVRRAGFNKASPYNKLDISERYPYELTQREKPGAGLIKHYVMETYGGTGGISQDYMQGS
jgi:hypothetical protein